MTPEEAEEIKKEWLKEYPSVAALQARMEESLGELTKVGYEQRRLAGFLRSEIRTATGKAPRLEGLESLPIETLRGLIDTVRDLEQEMASERRKRRMGMTW